MSSTLQSGVTDASISEPSRFNGRPKKLLSDVPPLVKNSISTKMQFLCRNRMLFFYLDSLLTEWGPPNRTKLPATRYIPCDPIFWRAPLIQAVRHNEPKSMAHFSASSQSNGSCGLLQTIICLVIFGTQLSFTELLDTVLVQV